MVRFNYKRPDQQNMLIYFPYYIEPWTSYDPNDTSKCIHTYGWKDVWQVDADRDKLHRQNSYYYRRNIADNDDDILENSKTLAILLFGSIIFCLFVPQILDLILTAFCPRPLPPPSPPTPPPGPKNRKRLRLYHYARATKITTNTSARRKSLFVGKDNFYYDPENILNYVSSTRIKTLHAYSEEEDEEPSSTQPKASNADAIV